MTVDCINILLVVLRGDTIDDSILDTFGIGFDGQTWIVARFAKSLEINSLDLTRTRFKKFVQSESD